MMEGSESTQYIEAETSGVDEICPRPYRLNAYDQLWERLVARLNGGSLDDSTQAVVEVGLLLAASLYRVERAIGVAASPDLVDDPLGQVSETV